ncbi:MAG: MATE family efflux transporter [Deltaproteobacteria bacterium]|jgi:MATE family, multidrug efflux pump|nr:MATE family efflux transporter [Deltaproteobacteria bacterium]
MKYLKNRWNCVGGYREVLVIALPLILSTATWSIQHFVDRMFLTWYSPETIAAAMPAGMLNFSIISIFMGTAGYVSTFVAQYYGAERYHRIGPAIWQGIYISLFGGLVLLGAIPLAEPAFRFIGHSPEIQKHEIIYFQILCLGGGAYIGSYALSGFFSGRGKTWPVMWVNAATTAVNLVLDYALIFGKWGFPELGIIGAAIATVVAGVFSLLVFFALLFSTAHDRLYHTKKGWRLEKDLLVRLLRFGFPSGVQFFLEISAFTVFVLLVGRLGTARLAATNIAFNINTLAFMPMIGCGIAISVMVGQYLGSGKSDIAQTAVYSGFHLTFVYMASIAAAYVLLPDLFVAPFAHQADPQRFAEIYGYSVVLLRFVAIYCLFDTMNIIFCSAIKGAGDTRYVMFMTTILSIFVLFIPVYLAVEIMESGMMVAWVFATAYVISLGVAFYLRFLGGKWRSMRVIEQEAQVPKIGPTKMGRTVK